MSKHLIKKWHASIPTFLSCKCPYCHKIPEIDYIVDDKFWKRIIPKKYRTGVVCLSCFYKLTRPIHSSDECFSHIRKIYYACKGITLKLKIEKIFRNPDEM